MMLGCGCDDDLVRGSVHYSPGCPWLGISAYDYPGVREWYRWDNGTEVGADELVAQAREDDAPFDAAYHSHDGVWRTIKQATRYVPTPKHGVPRIG